MARPAQAEAQKERLRQKREKEREQARLAQTAAEAAPQEQTTGQTEQAGVSEEAPAFGHADVNPHEALRRRKSWEENPRFILPMAVT